MEIGRLNRIGPRLLVPGVFYTKISDKIGDRNSSGPPKKMSRRVYVPESWPRWMSGSPGGTSSVNYVVNDSDYERHLRNSVYPLNWKKDMIDRQKARWRTKLCQLF